jgi:hypothetical protein
MLRIGLMLDSYVTSAWVAKIVEDIQSSGFAQVNLVVLNTPMPAKPLSLRERVRAHWRLTAYYRYEQWDYQRNRAKHDARASIDLSELLRDVPIVKVEPHRKGFTDRVAEEDLAKIRSAELDVIFRFGFRIIRGGILEAARFGVWSFHHDDNKEYRGGPPLFWEIYERNPISGTILQTLTDSLDGGRVLYRSHSSTEFSSLYLNRNPIYWKTAEFAIRRLRDLHERGFEYLQSLPTYNEKDTYTRPIYRTPTAAQMSVFLGHRLRRAVRGKIKAKAGGNTPQWFIAIRKRTSQHSFDDPSGYRILRPPLDRFYADPFLFKRDGRNYLFFEDLRYSDGQALISCAELDAEGNLGEIFDVLRCPYHLSYPFLFEHDGKVYMIPETKKNRTVELYRADEFPHRWKLEAVLLNNIFAVDATIHVQDGKFWMFAGISNGRYSNSDELGIFYADRLTGPWIPHRGNPVVSDVRRARPAGALFYHEGRLIRPSQDCGKAYGYALNFFEVLKLTEDEYEERQIGRIGPEWAKGNLGTHTYTASEDFEVIDGNFAAKISMTPLK